MTKMLAIEWYKNPPSLTFAKVEGGGGIYMNKYDMRSELK